jgi:hypothetical protein
MPTSTAYGHTDSDLPLLSRSSKLGILELLEDVDMFWKINHKTHMECGSSHDYMQLEIKDEN